MADSKDVKAMEDKRVGEAPFATVVEGERGTDCPWNESSCWRVMAGEIVVANYSLKTTADFLAKELNNRLAAYRAPAEQTMDGELYLELVGLRGDKLTLESRISELEEALRDVMEEIDDYNGYMRTSLSPKGVVYEKAKRALREEPSE